jgi:hypothetical protein
MCIWNISSTWIFRIIRMALDIPNWGNTICNLWSYLLVLPPWLSRIS